jgi:outer membrane protein TolC
MPECRTDGQATHDETQEQAGMKATSPKSDRHRASTLATMAMALAFALALTLAPLAQARCVDEDGADQLVETTAANAAPVDNHTPRVTLLTLVQQALHRSHAVGAAKLLAEASTLDVEEQKAANLPQLSYGAAATGLDAQTDPAPPARGNQIQQSLTLAAPLYDGGRIKELTGYKAHLAEAARLGQLSTEEQIALQTVSLALDRSRYQLQAKVWAQYAKKMTCLVDALQDIVTADKGRASELVQARKNQEQAELSRAQTLSQVRITEVRLRRLVGDELPPADGFTSVMLDTPPLDDLLAMAARSSEIGALDAQAAALDAYVRAVLAGDRPQVSWLVTAAKLNGASNAHSYGAGFNLSVPLFNAATTYTTSAARKRAEAARLQKLDALESRKERMAEVHEQAVFALDRAHQVADVVHDSDLVRTFTLQQWQQLGRRSLFDVMSAEGDHYNLRIEYVNALFDAQQANALLWSLGTGLAVRLE